MCIRDRATTAKPTVKPTTKKVSLKQTKVTKKVTKKLSSKKVKLTFKKVKGAKTVSYTHLDVYKRQVDYTVTYQNNVEVGEGKAILTGFGNFNNTKNVKMTIIPAKVKAFAGKANGKNVTLSWNKSEEVNGYNVYRRTTSTEEWTKIADVKDTSYVDSDIKEGKTYSYAIEGYTAKDDKTYVGKKVEIEVKNTQKDVYKRQE